MKNPSRAALIVFSLLFGVICALSSLAVQRWGVIAFWVIMIASIAGPLWLLSKAPLEPYRERLGLSLPLLLGLLVSSMGSEIGLSFWQGLLVTVPAVTVATFFADRILRRRESARDNAV